MDNWAVARLIDWAGGKDGNKQTKASLREELCDVAAKLAGPSPSPAERVLAETAATCWFAFRLHEAQYAASVKSEDGMTLAQSEHAQRRMDRAHRRFLSTVKTLAAVRRLALRAVQINVARPACVHSPPGTLPAPTRPIAWPKPRAPFSGIDTLSSHDDGRVLPHGAELVRFVAAKADRRGGASTSPISPRRYASQARQYPCRCSLGGCSTWTGRVRLHRAQTVTT